MSQESIGIIMNGVTGRMGMNQHLLRSIVPIIQQGGVEVAPNRRVIPEPILVGRNPDKLKQVCERSGIERWTTNLDEALNDSSMSVYFDAQTTGRRAEAVKKAVAAGKHIYCEKPCATSVASALELYKLCQDNGLKNGVVQDKLWLPGILKLKRLIDKGFFGKIHSVRGEFGYWVFEGHSVPAQRPSWNYRKADDGGIIVDMLCHWRYLFDNVFGPIKSLSCIGKTHIPERIDENGKPYVCDADDSAYAQFEIEDDIFVSINSSWTTRVRRDDLLTLHVDGSHGSAVAGLRECFIQRYENTPKPLWNPDIPQPVDFYEDWAKIPEQESFDNAFKAQWELFIKHLAADAEFPWDLKEGAKGIQLAELGLESWSRRSWIDVPEL